MSRAKPKNVTPDEAEPPIDIPDAVIARIAEPSVAPPSVEDVSRALVPLSGGIRATVADIALIPIDRATPAQRTQLVALRQQLDETRRDLSTWVDAIDISFRRAAIETHASEFALEDGVVTIEQQRGEWVVNVPALRSELKELVAHGTLTQVEYDAIFKTVVTEKADNTVLNRLAEKRGDEIREAITRNRVWKAGDPAAAKVKIQRRTPA